jgi:hypothetical protein
MDAQLILAIISILGNVVPQIGANSVLIGEIITDLAAIIPALVKEVEDVVPMIQNIITALKAKDGITPEQLAALDVMEAQLDADFDKAAADEGFGPPPAPSVS